MRLEWQKLRERNEALDCRVYARAAAWIAGADRWTDAMWRNLEQQVGASGETEDEDPADPPAPSEVVAGLIRLVTAAAPPAGVPVELHELMPKSGGKESKKNRSWRN